MSYVQQQARYTHSLSYTHTQNKIAQCVRTRDLLGAKDGEERNEPESTKCITVPDYLSDAPYMYNINSLMGLSPCTFTGWFQTRPVGSLLTKRDGCIKYKVGEGEVTHAFVRIYTFLFSAPIPAASHGRGLLHKSMHFL